MSDSFNPTDCISPGPSVHWVLQARILEWVAMTSSRGSSRPRGWTHISYVSCISRWVLYHLGSPVCMCMQVCSVTSVVSKSKSWRKWLLLFSHSIMSDSLWPHGLLHDRLSCPTPCHGIYSDSYPSSWWCHPTMSSSGIPFSSCLQSFLASGSFLMSRLFTSGGQRIGASALASVLPMKIQVWFL